MLDSIYTANAGEFFVGIGTMVLLFVMSWFLYQAIRYVKAQSDFEEKYEVLKSLILAKIAKEKGYDLEKELLKSKVKRKGFRAFRGQIEEEIRTEIFPQKEVKEEKKGK